MTLDPSLAIELAPAAASVASVGGRLAGLVRSIDDPKQPASGLAWSLGELAAHLAARTGVFADLLAGTREPQGAVGDIAAENERMILALLGQPVDALAEILQEQVERFVEASRAKVASDPFPWYSGLTVDAATGTGLLLSELLVHGWDLGRSMGKRWHIPPADAATSIRAAARVAPAYVDPDAAHGRRSTFRIAISGGPRFRIRFQDGAAELDLAEGEADCTIRADPVAFLLVSFGRRSKAWAIATGRMFAFGRRPWRALTFDRLFVSP